MTDPTIHVRHEGNTTTVEIRLGKRRSTDARETQRHRTLPRAQAREIAAAAFPGKGLEAYRAQLAKRIQEAVAGSIPEPVRSRPGRRPPSGPELRESAAKVVGRRETLAIEDGDELLALYRAAKARSRWGKDGPALHPDADRPVPRVGDPIDDQLLRIVEGDVEFLAWSRGLVSDALFGKGVHDELVDQCRVARRPLPVTLYGPMEALCEAEIEALGAVRNTDDDEGRLLPGMKSSEESG